MKFQERYAAFVIRNRILILIAGFFITLAAGRFAATVEFESDIEIWFLENDPSLLAYHDFLDRFTGDEMIVVGVLADDIFAPAVLKEIERITNEGAKAPFIKRARSLTNVKVPVVVEDDMRIDFLIGELPKTAEEVEALRAKAMANTLVRDRLVNPSGKATALLFEFVGEKNDFEEKVAAVNGLLAVVGESPPEGIEVILAGTPVFDRAFFEYSKTDFSVMGPLAILIVLLATFLLFRRFSATVLPVSIVILTVIWVHGVMGYLGIKVNMISTGLLTLSIAVGVADSVHILSEFYDGLREGLTKFEAAHKSTAHLLVPCFFTSATTSLGFLMLLAGDLAPIGEFGWLASIAVTIAFLLSVTVLPSLLCLIPVPNAETLRNEKGFGVERALARLACPTRTQAKIVLLTSAALMLSAAWGVTQIKTESNPVNYFKPDDPVRLEMVQVDRELGGSSSVEFLIETEPDGLKDPEILRRIDTLRQGLMKVAGVTQTFSALDPLVEAHKVFADGEGIPDESNMVAQLYLILEGEKEDFDSMIQGEYDVGRLSARTRFDTTVPMMERKAEMDALVAQEVAKGGLSIEMTGFVKLMTDMEVYLFRGQVTSFLLALAAISLVLFLLLRSIPLGLLALIPNLTPIAFGLAFMAVAGINLDPGTVMIGPIALGLVVDDTVHFLYRYRTIRGAGASIEEACQRTILGAGRAIATTSLILAAGFSVLAFGSFIPNIYFGVVTSVVVLVAMVADIVVLPSALIVFRPGD